MSQYCNESARNELPACTTLSPQDVAISMLQSEAPSSCPPSRSFPVSETNALPYELSMRQPSSASSDSEHISTLEPHENGEAQRNRPRSAAELWQLGTARVRRLLQVLRKFRTLRDMSSRTPLAPTQLEKLKSLGHGCSAVVDLHWLGTDRMKRRLVAVKQLSPKVATNKRQQELFIKEIRLMRKLQHKNIIQFLGAGSFDTSSRTAREETLFLVEEYMDGGTLSQLIARQMISEPHYVYTYCQALRWAIELAEALTYLHESHPMIIHRSVTSDNILVKGTDPTAMVVKLSDFGLHRRVPQLRLGSAEMQDRASMVPLSLEARRQLLTSTSGRPSFSVDRIEDVTSSKLPSSASLNSKSGRSRTTGEKAIRVGSFLYMAPEVFRGDKYNEKVDVFSFAMVMHELFQGSLARSRLIFGRHNEALQYAAKVAEGFRPPIRSSFPLAFRHLLQDCWAADMNARPSMYEVVLRLSQLHDAMAALDSARTVQNSNCCVLS